MIETRKPKVPVPCGVSDPGATHDLENGGYYRLVDICTWVGCDAPAKHELGDRKGRQWARLCDAHNEEMDRAANSPQVGDIVRAWVKAQGGARAAAERIVRAGNYERFMRLLSKAVPRA